MHFLVNHYTMEQFKGKVAVVTGASAGIGAATAKALVENGMTVVGIARRSERVEQLAQELKGKSGKLLAFKADLTKEEEIISAFKWTTDNVGLLSVLINNAGVNLDNSLVDGDTQKWKTVLDTNVLGVAIASREAIKIMRANDIVGHIVNVNSMAGHRIFYYPQLNVYAASKYALTAMTETLRLELIRLGSKIKVTSLSPGYVRTEFLDNMEFNEEMKERLRNMEGLVGEDVANAALYILGTPPHVQVTELTIKGVDQQV